MHLLQILPFGWSLVIGSLVIIDFYNTTLHSYFAKIRNLSLKVKDYPLLLWFTIKRACGLTKFNVALQKSPRQLAGEI
jgi:hypothetical protein